MKIVLSRKGFDSMNGGMPNPILPDGTLLMLPIPSTVGETTYQNIIYNKKTYFEIIQELNPGISNKLLSYSCHVDPDIHDIYKNNVDGWKPAFGQSGLSEKHLNKKQVGIGDIFLFFGWFRQTEYDSDGKLRFVKNQNDNVNTIDKHIIFGYMQIGEKISDYERIKKEYYFHPHAQQKYYELSDNALYIPAPCLSFDNESCGYGTLKYSPIRQLTKEGHSRSEWDIPKCFHNIQISYHTNTKYGWSEKNEYFKSANQGQEFVLDANDEISKWVKEVICSEK